MLVNLYGPNEDKPHFFTELQQIVTDLGNDNIMFCGDWNLILNETLDTENYVDINNPRARNAVLNIMEENGYIDVFRILNENQKKFAWTWRRINPVKKQARLDFYLVSEEIFQHVHDTSIIPGYRSDNSGIYLKIKLHENERGRGYWKFNNTLLKDKDYVNVVKLQIQETIYLYSRNNFNNNNNVEFTINDQLFLETLLMVIRGETIKYSSRKKKRKYPEELKLEEEITKIEENININLLDTDANELNILEDMKTRLQEIRQKKLEGVILRSKCRYEDMGEKPTKYFLSLESRNFISKVITKLTNSDGENYTNTNDILHYQKKYYLNLYSESLEIDEKPLIEIIGNNPNKLTNDESINLEGEITNTKLATALRNMKKCKSPGNDSFTTEFFKFFWPDLGYFILRSLNFAYINDCLSVTQKQGIITCIPKPNKPRNF